MILRLLSVTLLASIVVAQVDVVPASGPAIGGAILPGHTNATTGILLPNPVTPTCEVGITLGIINGSYAFTDLSQPTVSPVPSVVIGNLSLEFANLNVTNLESYVVTLNIPYGVILTNLTSGVQQLPRVGFNNTMAVDIVINETLAAAARDTNTLNMSVIAPSQDFIPRSISVNSERCALGLTPNVTAVPKAFTTDPNQDPSLSSFAVSGAVGTNGPQLVGVDGQPLTLKGANWFGFETQANMVDGLYFDETLRGDLATVTYRIQLLGFNAIRVPFSFLVLYQQTPTNYQRPCTISSEAEIRANVIDPANAASIPANAQPPNPVDPPADYGTSPNCNDYVPENSVLTRFLYVVGYFARQGLYVLIDNHANTDPTVVNNPDTWVSQWASLLTQINQDPVAASRVMVDVLNEPQSRGLTWDNMNTLYVRAMDAMYQVNPNTLFFIEGVGNQEPIEMCWGDGYVTNEVIIQEYGMNDPNPFFQTILQRPYLNNVVISPHYYGPSVSGATSNYTGAGLAYRASTSWGYLGKTGYNGHVFPIVIGETGSFLTSAPDLAFYNDFSLYLRNEAYMNDGQHNAIQNLFWWDWNANSGDTGGLVYSDWYNVTWNKIEYLETAIGLTPWCLIASGGAPSPTPTATPAPATPSPTTPAPTTPSPTTPPPTPTAAPTSVPTPAAVSPPPPVASSPPPPVPTTAAPTAPATPAPTAQATPTPPATMTAAPSPTPVPPTPTTTPSPTPATPTGGISCRVTYSASGTWVNNGLEYGVLNFNLANTGASPITTPYPIVASSPAYQGVNGYWNWQVSVSNGVITGTSDPNASWETLEPNAQNSPTVGLVVQVASGTGSLAPNSVTISGSQCTLVQG